LSIYSKFNLKWTKKNNTGAYKALMGKPERSPLERPRQRWKDNIKMNS
jgi:hypothetical protein